VGRTLGWVSAWRPFLVTLFVFYIEQTVRFPSDRSAVLLGRRGSRHLLLVRLRYESSPSRGTHHVMDCGLCVCFTHFVALVQGNHRPLTAPLPCGVTGVLGKPPPAFGATFLRPQL
jgi:hypothetical protein